VTKPNPENCRNCSSKCAYDCSRLHYTIQHRTVLIISLLPLDNQMLSTEREVKPNPTKQLLSTNSTLTLCVGDGFFGCGHPESSSSPAACFVIICSLFLLAGCDNSVLVMTSFLELNTLSVDDVFFFSFFLLFSSSPVLLCTMAFGGLSNVDALDFVLTL